jgi:phosphoglycolate phosphatase
MKKVDLMIFDFDGTIADTGADIAFSVNYTLASMRLTPLTYAEIISFVGDGVVKLLERALGGENKTRTQEAMTIFSSHYEKHMMDRTVLCANIEGVLKYFGHKMKVILTNKRHHLTAGIARGLRVDRYFMEIVGADSTPYQKPDPRTVEYLLEKYTVSPQKAVLIGDGINDIAAAQNAGIVSCCYLNGLGDRKSLLRMGADFYCEDLIEINTMFQ